MQWKLRMFASPPARRYPELTLFTVALRRDRPSSTIEAMRPAISHFLAAISLYACAAPTEAPPVHPLAGTAWRLHAIQSMDDAQGTTRVADPDAFTLRFDGTGQVILRLDCNRGTASWEAKAGGVDSGSIRFGPIAATRALCPPPHLDERIARDLPYVRGYRLLDGKLFLSLMADAGIYEWHAAKGPR